MTESGDETGIASQPKKRPIRFDIFPLARTCIKLIGSWLAIWGLGYYKFSPSWVALGAVGYLAYSRAQEKRAVISGAMRAIGTNEKQSILDNIGAHELPSWVYFPDIERAEWLNKVIQRLWPYISEYVTKILNENVQSAVNENLPSSLRPFKFLRTDLGDTPPRIGGVKIYTEESIRRDEIVMDLDIMLYSDARIKVSVGKIIAGVKDFELRGIVRVLMKPLVPKIPFAGAVTVCFLDNPYINFLLTHVGNILTMPGLQQTLNRTIQDAVSSLCVLPNRITVSLVDDVVIEQLKFPSAQGAIRVHVISASDLIASDINVIGKNSSDPYCVVRVGAQKFVTKVKDKTLNPTWNECFEAIVDQRFGQSVQIEVWDQDKGNKDDELGIATIPIENVYLRGELNTAVTLEGVKRGKVHLKITWLDLSSIPSDFDAIAEAQKKMAPSERVNFTSYLFVRVEQAKNLIRLKFLQEPSPYCVLQIGNLVQNTGVREKTQTPVWESPHHFLFSNAGLQTLNIEVRDSKTELVLGNVAIPLKYLMAEKDMKVTRPYSLQAAGPDSAVIYLHLELRALVPGADRRPDSFRSSVDLGKRSREVSTDVNPATPSGEDVTEPAASSPAADNEEMVNGKPPLPDSDTLVRKRQSGGKTSLNGSEDGVPSLVRPPDPAGRLRLSINYNIDLEILEVVVERAENLLGVDKQGLSDPYVKLSVLNYMGKIIGDSKKTHVVKDDLNPTFDESFEFAVKSELLAGCRLQVEIKNRVNVLQRNSQPRVIGYTSIPLRDVTNTGGCPEWYWLNNMM